MSTQTDREGEAVVLIVDDDAFVGRALACILKEARGAQVHLARSGDEALPLAHALAPDLILSDVQMPGMTVLQFCRGLRESADTRHTPLYLLTGVMAGDQGLRQLGEYVQGVLSKPPDPVELLGVLDGLRGKT